MTAPVRLRLSRARGFNLQAWSRAVNGLVAVSVVRPGKWGNPYRVTPAYRDDYCSMPAVDAEGAVLLFRSHLTDCLSRWPSMRDALDELRGKNLACWCAPDAPCHADVLLELANR